jgi:PAS domain S-box-containing protein
MTSPDHESLYRSFFNATLDGLAYCRMIVDRAGRPIDFVYQEVNENFEKLTGLKNVVGKKVTELIPGIVTTNPELFEIYGRVASTGTSERFETYLPQLASWFLVFVYSFEKGTFVAVFENFTDQKRTEQALQNEKSKYEVLAKDLEKFKLAVDNVSDQVVIADPEGITIYINKATERITGYTAAEIMNKKVGTLWHLPMPLAFYQDFWKTIKTDKKTFVGELQNRRKNGEVYDAEINVSPVLDEKNNVVFFVGIERDISNEKKLVKTEGEALAKDNAVLASIGDGLVVTDRDGKITLVNQAFTELTGWKSAEVIGKSFADTVPREDEKGNAIPFNERILEQTIRGKLAVISPVPATDPSVIVVPPSYFIRKDGTKFPVTGVVSPIHLEGTIVGAVEVFHDITKEKEIDRAKSEFMSLASHQLRTPPSIIGWYTETLQSGDLGPINEKQAEYLAEIYKANQRMVATINSLLNISRIEMGTFAISVKDIKIKDIVDETVEELASRFKRNVTLKKDYDPALGLFKGDPNILQIIIDNLLSNAFKYSDPKNTKIEIVAKLEHDSLLLSVKDNGIGIPSKDQARVFEKLFRGDNAVATNPDGTGLGLYMIKKIIVDGLGGKIWFESKENHGSTFFVSLPASGMKEKSGTTALARVSQYFTDAE